MALYLPRTAGVARLGQSSPLRRIAGVLIHKRQLHRIVMVIAAVKFVPDLDLDLRRSSGHLRLVTQTTASVSKVTAWPKLQAGM